MTEPVLRQFVTEMCFTMSVCCYVCFHFPQILAEREASQEEPQSLPALRSDSLHVAKHLVWHWRPCHGNYICCFRVLTIIFSHSLPVSCCFILSVCLVALIHVLTFSVILSLLWVLLLYFMSWHFLSFSLSLSCCFNSLIPVLAFSTILSLCLSESVCILNWCCVVTGHSNPTVCLSLYYPWLIEC